MRVVGDIIIFKSEMDDVSTDDLGYCDFKAFVVQGNTRLCDG